MRGLIEWLAGTALSHEIQNLLWIVPAVQTVHLVAVAAVLSSVLMVGLRLLDRAGTFQSVDQTLDRYLPWILGGLCVLLATGAVLVIGEPARTLGNPSFWVKMVLLAIVFASALALRNARRRGPGVWETPSRTGRAMRLMVAFNFVLWCAVAVAGRWIAYTKS